MDLETAKAEMTRAEGELGVPPTGLLAVRLVSHHMRLLGVLHRGTERDVLIILLDYDDTK